MKMHRNCCSVCCTTRMLVIWTVVVALLFGGSLLLTFWGVPQIIKEQIHLQTQLKNGTEQWDRWEELPFAINFTVRFFNVTNPDEVVYNNTKPILRETGPYTYKLSLKKEEIRSDDEEEDSVTYYRSMSFEFDNSGTTKETDEVTVINSVLMSSLQLTTSVERLALAGCIEKFFKPYGMDTIFITKPVGQLIFGGIDFSFSNASLGYACKYVHDKMLDIVGKIRVIEHIDNGKDDGNDYLKFSVYRYKTKLYTKTKPDGLYTVNRGIKNVSMLGDILRWNSNTHISTWGNDNSVNNDTCNAIRGTDSTIYHPQLEENEDLYIYNTDLCRTVKLVYKNSNESYLGVDAYRYELSDSTFRPTTLIKEQDCFCSKATKDASGNDNCYLDGVFDFKPCLGAPTLVSQPHFLNADQHYLDGVVGLSPDESKHNIYLLLEPNTGTPLVGMKRVQINSILKRQPFMSFITPDTMYEGVIPLLWQEEEVMLPQEYVDKLNNDYFKVVKIAKGLTYALIAVVALLLVSCCFFLWRKEYYRKKTI